jgi:AMP-polyphosphate phosphotransferase
MFETAELGRKIDKESYRARAPELRTELLQLQRKLEEADFPVIVLVHGVDGSGRGDIVNLLNGWMDTRSISTVAFDAPTEEERHRPAYWRYWMALPPAGRIAIFTGSWYTDPILKRVYGEIGDAKLDAAMQRVNAFERTLTDRGALFVKLWLHVDERRQGEELARLARGKRTRWRVTRRDWEHHRMYGAFRSVCERVLRSTSTGESPWFVVESSDARYRNITAAEHIAERLRVRLEQQRVHTAPRPLAPIDDPETILDTLDLSRSLDREEYGRRLEKLQGRLHRSSRRARARNVGAIVMFEGPDAAGKGGAIRRLITAIDARQYRVIRVAAPTDEERAHHYLWRFWRHLPRLGRFTFYDRSWYGRVLVERVEGFATQDEWMRAYKEINDFEEQLVDHGIVLVKLWLHISSAEQLRRFEERARTPWKQYKITDEDFRNREKAHNYELAASDMIERTSTEYAPWTLVEADDKRWARVKVLDVVCRRLREAL